MCFDELDRGFDPTDDCYKRMLVGLILAARAVNQLARDAKKRLSVIVFLRDDIYQLLRFEDKNKITENFLSQIEWDSPKTKWTLRELMERRFGATIADQQALDWDQVFDESQEMPGRQTKYRHILDRTFRRPRDMIKFCNDVLERPTKVVVVLEWRSLRMKTSLQRGVRTQSTYFGNSRTRSTSTCHSTTITLRS